MDVTLRDLEVEDAARIANLLDNRNIWDQVRDYLPSPYTRVDADTFIAACQKHKPPQNKAICWKDDLVGICGAHPLSDVYRQTFEIGYWIGEPYWGKNIGTMAVSLLTKYVIQNFECTRIEAQVFEINPASARVLEKNGFVLEARMKNRVIKNEVLMDALLYAYYP